MFIAYHVDDEGGIPVATGTTRTEAQSAAIVRILSRNITHGGIGVQESKLAPEEFEQLTRSLDEFFAKH